MTHPEVRDREADRAQYPDPDFNRWLDESITENGEVTVWDTFDSTDDAYAGWAARPSYERPTRDAAQKVELLQAGLSNDELRLAFESKLPGVIPTERELSIFAVGAEVGADELAAERQSARMYFDERNSARDAWRRAANARDELRVRGASMEPYGQITTHNVTGQQFFYRWPQPPYLDNASECVTVYAGAAPTSASVAAQCGDDDGDITGVSGPLPETGWD